MYSPTYRIQIGVYAVDKAVDLKVNVSKNISSGYVVLPSAAADIITAKKLDEVKVFAGYDGEEAEIFSGLLVDTEGSNTYYFADYSILLNKRITNTFVNATPQEIVKYIISMAGVRSCSVSSEVFGKISSMTAINNTAGEILKRINDNLGINTEYGFDGDCFRWGVPTEHNISTYYLNESNITRAEEVSGVVTAETVLLPGITIYDRINMDCSGIDGDYNIEGLTFCLNDGFLRTKIKAKR